MKYFFYFILILYLILIDGLNRIVQHRFSTKLRSDNGYFERLLIYLKKNIKSYLELITDCYVKAKG